MFRPRRAILRECSRTKKYKYNTLQYVEYLDKRVGIVSFFYRRVPEDDTPVPKHVGLFNTVLVMNCILLSAFLG